MIYIVLQYELLGRVLGHCEFVMEIINELVKTERHANFMMFDDDDGGDGLLRCLQLVMNSWTCHQTL